MHFIVAQFIFVDADPYIPGGGGAQYYTNQNNLYVIFVRELNQTNLITPSFRSVRNFVIDVTRYNIVLFLLHLSDSHIHILAFPPRNRRVLAYIGRLRKLRP